MIPPNNDIYEFFEICLALHDYLQIMPIHKVLQESIFYGVLCVLNKTILHKKNIPVGRLLLQIRQI